MTWTEPSGSGGLHVWSLRDSKWGQMMQMEGVQILAVIMEDGLYKLIIRKMGAGVCPVGISKKRDICPMAVGSASIFTSKAFKPRGKQVMF